MDDANASIKRTLAMFEAEVHKSLRVREILLDASYIDQTNKKLGSPRKLTAASLITSWINESTDNLKIVHKAWHDVAKRRPCCLNPEKRTVTKAPDDFLERRKSKYEHDECYGLAIYWVEKLNHMTLRNANLQVALAIVNERQVDLKALRIQAMRAVKSKTSEIFRPSSYPMSATETKDMESRSASPELSPPPAAQAKQIKDSKRAKTVSFARSTDALGQEASSRTKRSFNRTKLDSYIPGRWAPPNRKAAAHADPDYAPRKRGKRSCLSTKYSPEAAQSAVEPFDPYAPPSFFNTYADYTPCPSPPPGPADEPALAHDDLFLDTSGLRVASSAFYHDDPLLDPEERALEDERRAVWDAFLPPVPTVKTTLMERMKRRWSCVF